MDRRSLIDDAQRAAHVEGFIISQTAYEAGSALMPHYHDRDYFCIVTSGRFEERASGGSHRCTAETVVFHPRGAVHADTFDAATRCLNVELPDDLGLMYGEFGDAFVRRGQRRGPGLAALARRIERELRVADAASRLALHGLVLELTAEWIRAPASGRRPAWLAEAQRIVRAEYTAGIDCRDIAARVGVHPVRLSREFRIAYRVTMTELALRLRVEHAARLLRTTRRPLVAIALDAGFTDQSHLAKAFRRLTGTTCARYRRAERVEVR